MFHWMICFLLAMLDDVFWPWLMYIHILPNCCFIFQMLSNATVHVKKKQQKKWKKNWKKTGKKRMKLNKWGLGLKTWIGSRTWLILFWVYFLCLSQPTLRHEGDAGLTGASSMGGKYAESPPTFILGKRLKNRKRCGLRTLSMKGSSVVFMHGEGISTPRVRHKGRQPLVKCANMTSNCIIFPFLRFLCLFLPFIFLSFCGRQGCFPCSYVFLNCDKEIRPT